jgi:hypothetical protein
MNAALGDVVEEIRFYLSQGMVDEARVAMARAEAVSPGAPVLIELRAQLSALPPTSSPETEIEIFIEPDSPEATAQVPGPPLASDLVVTAAGELRCPEKAGESITQVSSTSLREPGVPPTAEPSSAGERSAWPRQAGDEPAPEPAEDILSGFVFDLEESLGEQFTVGTAAQTVPGLHSAPLPAIPAQTPAAFPRPAAKPDAAPPDTGTTAPTLAPEEVGDESAGLVGLFAEFKEEVESSSTENDDPETRYNLGMAFKEMGLLDEAIGELQKVCKAAEGGHAFPKTLEAYTWLAHCFVQKGLPEAAVHWYEKALQLPGLGDEQTVAIRYELACAHHAAGDLSAARRHFMHVLSVNIDYRDVAQRIQSLRT